LNVLNQRLWGRSQAFATCLALRIAANGEATLANAGHLPRISTASRASVWPEGSQWRS